MGIDVGHFEAVDVSADGLTLGQVRAVAAGATVSLADEVVALLHDSRLVVDEAVARGDLVYGVTTGVGHARNEALPADALAAMQPMLLETHAGGLGEPLPRDRVRAGMVARLNGFARGGSGVSPAVAQGLADLLNHAIHPVIPGTGSVGAGDLGQLAMVGRVLLGRGSVEVDGQLADAAAALERAGLEPVALQPKDGLALLSSNALSIGHAALLVGSIERLLALADLVVATSMEAFGANPSIIEPTVARAGAVGGQRATADAIREALRDGEERREGMSVQDPLSFRVVPQVHGACRDTLATMTDATTAELNAASDNPLVDVGAGRIISNGNFHPMNLALAAETMRIALAHVGLLAERRMGQLFDAAITALGTLGAPPAGAGPPDGQPGPPDGAGPPGAAGIPATMAGLGLRYPAAALSTRLRHLANPITLDVPTLDLAVEDHATNLAEALDKVDEAIDVVHDLLTVELLVAVALRNTDPDAGRPGNGTGHLLTIVGDTLDGMPAGAMPHAVQARVASLLRHREDAVVSLDGEAP